MGRGERLEVERRIAGTTVSYTHHGIDLGDGTVVHARPDDFRAPFSGGRVVRTSLEAFADGRPVRVTVDPPARFPPDAIAARALAQVGRAGYCPLVDNCEHFATWCATGIQASRQVEVVIARAAAVVALAAGIVTGLLARTAVRGGGAAAAATVATGLGRRARS